MLMGVLLALLVACGASSDDSTPSPGSTPPPVVAVPTCTAEVTANAPLTDISTVQGAGSISPLVSQTVTVRGVVVGEFQNQTVSQLNGFFIQQSVPDADPLT
jgi:uncharacterized protein